jgi:hypothetical protein
MILSIAATTTTESVTLNNDAKVEEQLGGFRQDKVRSQNLRPLRTVCARRFLVLGDAFQWLKPSD